MTQDWHPGQELEFQIHPEGWALLIVFCAVVAFVTYLFVGIPG